MSTLFTPGKHNCIWKEWRRIGLGKDARFFIEHRQAVLESLKGEHPPSQVLISDRLYSQKPEYWQQLALDSPRSSWYLIGHTELDRVISVSQSSGLCGIYEPKPCTFQELCLQPFLFVAWNLADPGNLGTLIRAQQALVGGGLLSVSGCQPWSSKVARSSTGYLLNSKICRLAREEEGLTALYKLRENGYEIYAALPRAKNTIDRLSWSAKVAVLLGNETRGLPVDIARSALAFRIPSLPLVESLNVAMTGTIVAWEYSKRP